MHSPKSKIPNLKAVPKTEIDVPDILPDPDPAIAAQGDFGEVDQ